MTEVQILDIMYEAFQLAMKLSLPFLLLSMIVGVVIAVFQAATQINEPVSYTHLQSGEPLI